MKPRPLVWRIFPSYLLVLVLALAAVTTFGALAMRRFYLDQTASVLEARARLVYQQLQPHLVSGDAAGIDALCKTAGHLSETRITVMNRFGKVLGDSQNPPEAMEYHQDRPEFITAHDGRIGRSVRYSTTLNQTLMYVAIATPRSDHPHGPAHLGHRSGSGHPALAHRIGRGPHRPDRRRHQLVGLPAPDPAHPGTASRCRALRRGQPRTPGAGL